MPIERTIYHCKICKRIFFKKGNCIRHERDCWIDVENKSCITCFINMSIKGWCPKKEERRDTYSNNGGIYYVTTTDKVIVHCENWVPIKVEDNDEFLSPIKKYGNYRNQRIRFSIKNLEKKNANKNS